ncbi:UBIQUITIN-60S ribosomal protein L40 [Anaeramoeba ignava]|uniref:UBIQUITIN-60S ribosomal protein L40 n=1 Tax=Anaeramoeba ignava TaxID=1746090 RepID=A0A9Q0LGM3_ANAIG|nr:UBIQUITIN-60S ribosomal protein L40 [Anaeramoeba ignava]
MEICVKTLAGTKYLFDIEPNDSIIKLKDEIQDKIGIPPNSQRLFSAGVILEDGNTFSYYGIIDDKIENKIGIPLYSQRLVFPCMRLEDEKTFSYYGIVDGSIIYLVLAL